MTDGGKSMVSDVYIDAVQLDRRDALMHTRADDERAFSSVELYESIGAADREWSALMPDAVASAYQTPGFAKAWIDNAGTHEGYAPLIIGARDADGRLAALLPLAVRRKLGVTAASFIGGTHSNYNMPVFRRDALGRFSASECARLLQEAGAAAGVDLFALENQPTEWEGVQNPFAALPGQPSPAPAFCGPLAATMEQQSKILFSSKTRSKQRRKLRRFEEMGATRIYRAETEEERRKLLDAFFSQKSRQFAERGIADVFSRPGVRDFLGQALGLNGAASVMDIYGFELDGEPLAVTGGFALNGRYSNMIISIVSGEHAKYSPGEMLLNGVTEDVIKRGLKTFDLGVGVANYKTMFCPNVEQLRDAFVGVTAKGRAVAAIASSARGAKGWAKNNQTVYGALHKLRALKSRIRPSASQKEEEAADD